ncbi:MAG UNVERIFIED_CONTAM: hypothetical protein LVR29_24655 [Microcystis novacekii LVE1205-3]
MVRLSIRQGKIPSFYGSLPSWSNGTGETIYSYYRRYPGQAEAGRVKRFSSGSDLLILPTTPNHLDIDVTIKAAELLSTMTDNYRVLLTQVDSRTKTGREARKALEEAKLPAI